MNAPRRFPRAAPPAAPLGSPLEPVNLPVIEALVEWLMVPPSGRGAHLEAVAEVLLQEGLYDLNVGDLRNVLHWLRRYRADGYIRSF
mgnify:CR=1 FL=1